MNSVSIIINAMKVLEPKELEARKGRRDKKQKTKRRKRSMAPIILLVAGAYIAVSLLAPLPALKASTTLPKLPLASPVNLTWPSHGQAAIGAVGYGALAKNGDQTPLPTASLAKVLVAVAVLKSHPLQAGEQGDTITITKNDEATYTKYLAQFQSVIKVQSGEQLTEYQALQAMLLPSANNMAEILAGWAFGSMDQYITFANQFAKTLGMTNTVIADASGYSPQTTSTAVDLEKLAEIAMNNPVLSKIVEQQQANLPVSGIVYNVNNQLGKNGIVGIKTGNTDEAGGCYMFAATRKIDDTNSVTVVGVVMGASDLRTAIADSLPLLDSAFKGFRAVKPIEPNQIVGKISQPGGEVSVSVKVDSPIVSWTAQAPTSDIEMNIPSSGLVAGEKVGTLNLHVGELTHAMNLVADGTLPERTPLWRLRHGGGYF